MRIFKILIIISTLILIGCNKKSASTKNFKKSLQSFYSKNPECLNLYMSYNKVKFPYLIEKNSRHNDKEKKQFNYLVELELLAKKTIEDEEEFLSVSMTGKSKKKIVEFYSYDLTEKGKKHIKLFDENFLGKSYKLCIGNKEIIQVTNFTEPSQAFGGVTLSTVNYNYKLKGAPSWLKSSAFIEIFKEAKKYTQSEINSEKNEELILTNNGWVTAREYSQES